MLVTDKVIRQITETKYLTAENAWRYRSIMRYFYYQHERIKYWLYKEEVFEELKNYELFHNYTMEQCLGDLTVLVEWGNLSAVQDTGKAVNIEAFKSRQFRYELTEYSIEIERLTVHLENLFVEGGSLEPNLLERLRGKLVEIKNMAFRDEKTVGQWWNDVDTDFRRLNQSYQDYIRNLYSMRAEEMMKTKAFILFKDKFITYLRDFIKSLQNNASEIEIILDAIDKTVEKTMLDKVISYELSVPRLDTIPTEQITDNVYGKWKNLKEWFMGSSESRSEASKLLDITNEIIRKITRYAVQISENYGNGINRKEEYRKICSMFLSSPTVEDAHCLSAHVFGVPYMRHIQADFDRYTETISASVYDEQPYTVSIKPRIRTYKEKISSSAVRDRQEEKRRTLDETLRRRKEEDKLLESYIADGCIYFNKLKNISPYVRQIFLKWLSIAMVDENYRGKTETGKMYEIVNPEEKMRCIVTCDDGTFEMPSYIIRMI